MSLILGTKIGAGSYGVVYRGRWGVREVAAKKYHVTVNESDQTTVQKEIRALKSLSYRHIIQFYGTTYHEGDLVVLTDLAEGGSLRAAINNKQIQDWPTKERLAQEMARGLAYIHSEGVLHLDLKSDNVLLSKHMEVKLCDIGLAEVKTTSASRSTMVLKGTVRWMAPELFVRRPKYSTKSDVYSLGMVMWEMAANCTTPFKEQRDNSMVALLIARGEKEDLPDDTPQQYRELVERCWDQEPSNRPEAEDMIIEVLEQATQAEDIGQGSVVDIAEAIRGMAISLPSSESTHTESRDSITGSGTMVPSTLSASVSSQSNDHVALTCETMMDNADAQVALAAMYAEGRGGVVKDEVTAYGWYLRAAIQGHSTAQCRVGELCYNGKGTTQSDTKAFEWFYKSALQGYAVAQSHLAKLFLDGRGVQQSNTEALFWYRTAANQGNAAAQHSLGAMHLHGCGVRQNDFGAASWFRKAADQGSAEAQCDLGEMYEHGRGVEKSDANAIVWYRRAADQGFADAQYNLARLYHEGLGVEQCDAEAVVWLRRAAEHGLAQAQFGLGWMYDHGRGVVQNDKQAFHWYLQSAEQGHRPGQCSLGVIYELGLGVEQSDEKASAWLRKAADQDERDAQLHLEWIARKAHRGRMSKGDADTLALYRNGAQDGYPAAQYNLAMLYEKGRRIPKDMHRAISWYHSAAENGHEGARKRVKYSEQKTLASLP